MPDPGSATTHSGAAPRLETARLVLRGAEARDVEPHAAMLGDPVVMHFLGTALDREQAWRKLLQNPGLWALLGFGYWSVERSEDGVFLGQVGFADFKRDVSPSLEGLPEMGWLFAAHAHGQGYAAEAVTAALAWADENLRPSEIVAIIHPANSASIRLAERSGFRRSEDTLYRGDPTLIFRRA